MKAEPPGVFCCQLESGETQDVQRAQSCLICVGRFELWTLGVDALHRLKLGMVHKPPALLIVYCIIHSMFAEMFAAP